VLVDVRGEERKIPLAWTSLAPVDPYRLMREPPLLRVESLVELWDWLHLCMGVDGKE
jgi:hypothetical protein